MKGGFERVSGRNPSLSPPFFLLYRAPRVAEGDRGCVPAGKGKTGERKWGQARKKKRP